MPSCWLGRILTASKWSLTDNNAVRKRIVYFFLCFVIVLFFYIFCHRHVNQNKEKVIREKIFLKKERERKKICFTTYNHTLCTEDYNGLRTSRSNIDKKLISYNTRSDALFTVETGLGLGTGNLGLQGYGGLGKMGRTAKSSVCPIGSKPEHAVYLHISVQYIKYSLVFFFIQKNTFFSFLRFF